MTQEKKNVKLMKLFVINVVKKGTVRKFVDPRN